VDTITQPAVSEIKMKLLHAISKSKWNGICLAEFGGPGLGAVRQSLFADRSDRTKPATNQI